MLKKASRRKTTVLMRFKPGEVFDEPPVKSTTIEASGVYQDDRVFYVEEENGLCLRVL